MEQCIIDRIHTGWLLTVTINDDVRQLHFNLLERALEVIRLIAKDPKYFEHEEEK